MKNKGTENKRVMINNPSPKDVYYKRLKRIEEAQASIDTTYLKSSECKSNQSVHEKLKDVKQQPKYEKEKNSYKDMLLVRANAFVEGAKECGLEILPYRDGFFTSIPCDNPMKACEELAKENLYLVPLKMGLRFAVCAVEESKCKKAPAIIKEVLDRI